MSFAARCRKFFSSKGPLKRSLPKSRRPLRVEPLEDRRMLSITLFVDGDAAAGGYGLDWPVAFADLQDALMVAELLNTDGVASNDVDQIWIAEGTYSPSEELESGDARSASFSLLDGVSLYGGFVGNETSLDQRDLSAAHTTTLSGDLGTLDEASDNAYTVVYCGESVEAVLDGLTITSGNANGDFNYDFYEESMGGGIYNAGTLTINDSTVTENSASSGGGIFNNGGSLTVVRSTFSGNTATVGGGIYSDEFSGDSTLTMTNSVIEDNMASYNGGGLYSRSEATITNSTIVNNTAGTGSSGGSGGGIYNNYGNMTLVNLTIANNAAPLGGGICNYGTSTTMMVTNSTIASNSATLGGGINNDGDSLTVTLNNTIVAANSATHGGTDIYHGSGVLSGFYNLIGNGENQTGLLDDVAGNQVGTSDSPIDPGLGDWMEFDNGLWGYSLSYDSPAYNAGNMSLLPADLTDMDGDGDTVEPIPFDIAGNDRVYGVAVDIGAYECQTPYLLPGDANLDGKVDGSDVTILAANWQTGVLNTQYATWSMGDFNGDGRVDGSDVTILAGNWQCTIPNRAPQLDNPIADMLLDDGDTQPDLIDLTTVFSDIDSDLTFSAVSSNPDLVTVQIVDGTKLQVTYLDYAIDQDRTPAVITITATEIDSDETLSVDDTFTVTVTPVQPVEVYLIVRDTATDTVTAEMTTALPTSLSAIGVGSSYVVEIWVTNTYSNGSSCLGVARGDLEFDNALTSASSLSHVGLFDTATEGTIDNANGEVVDFGGLNVGFVEGAGVAPYYSRLGYVEFEALTTGTQNFTFSPDLMAMVSGGAPINLEQIEVVGASVTQVDSDESFTFDSISWTGVSVAGTIAGVELEPSPSDAAHADATSGSLEIIFDDYINPTGMEILSGYLDVDAYDGPPTEIQPGLEDTDTADFGLENDLIQLALRDVVFNFSSEPVAVNAGTYFDTSAVDVALVSGTIDYLTTSGLHGSFDLVGESLHTQQMGNGFLNNWESAKSLCLFCDYTVDLSGVFGAGSELTFMLILDAECDPSSSPSVAAISTATATFQPPMQATMGIATVAKQNAIEPRRIILPYL